MAYTFYPCASQAWAFTVERGWIFVCSYFSLDAQFDSTPFLWTHYQIWENFYRIWNSNGDPCYVLVFFKVYRLWDKYAFISTHLPSAPTPSLEKICKIFPQMPHLLDSSRLFFPCCGLLLFCIPDIGFSNTHYNNTIAQQ